MTLIISMFQRKITKRQLNFRHRISEIITLGIFTLYLSNVTEVPNQHNMAANTQDQTNNLIVQVLKCAYQAISHGSVLYIILK